MKTDGYVQRMEILVNMVPAPSPTVHPHIEQHPYTPFVSLIVLPHGTQAHLVHLGVKLGQYQIHYIDRHGRPHPYVAPDTTSTSQRKPPSR